MRKDETFTFGGVDSRSNPANFPSDRALRCLNFEPQASGALRLRSGYTQPIGPVADGIPIHSLIYYEQFSANYLGLQFALFGKTDNVYLLNMASGAITQAFNDKKLGPPATLVAADGGAGGTLAAGTWFYVVTALDVSGGETTISNEVSITIGANHKVVLTWAAETGAVGYNVYRGTATGNEVLLTGTGLPATTNTYTDDGSASAASSFGVTQIVANGGGSPLANVQLTLGQSSNFRAGQSVSIGGNSNSLFNTPALVSSIPDSTHVIVSAAAFTAAGTGGATSQGPLSPASFADGGGGGGQWGTGSSGAEVETLALQASNLLLCSAQGVFNIPSNATINGIVVTVQPEATFLGFIFDKQVTLLKFDVPVGGNRSNSIAWASTARSYGAPNDLWNTTWTPADINNNSFGFGVAIQNTYGGQQFVTAVDGVTITVYYTVPATGLTGTGGTLSAASAVPPVFNTTQIIAANQMGSANPWGHFRSGNRVFLSSGGPWVGRFFQSDLQSWDGSNLRPVGLPGLEAFSNSTPAPTVSVVSNPNGSIAPTTLTGYQLYGAIYNPITQHMGNRFPLGNRVTVGATESSFVIDNLPNPQFVGVFADPYPEWVLALGMTNDGGDDPFWFIDANGNNIVTGNSDTTATVLISDVNAQQELPFRNDLPPRFDKFARVGTRIFAGLSGNQFLSYSNDEADVSNADYVGNPVESWPADQQEPLPTGELPTAIHAYRLEGWFYSRNNLCIWSQFLLQQGVNPWRGPWPGGCAGQRAWVETPYGPFWVSGDKQLCTFMEDGVISVSEEYEAALLAKISNQNLGQTEVAYLRDPDQLIDKVVIRGLDASNNPVIVVHDFKLKDERSPLGQGYSYGYTGLTVRTFAGAGFTPRQNVYDTSGKMRLWAGSNEGFIAQLEDGVSDNGSTYAGDYIPLINLGPNRPLLARMEYQGDRNVQFSVLTDYTQNNLGAFSSRIQERMSVVGTRYEFKINQEARWFYCRFQLTSHPADGNFAMSDPPFLPMPTYGSINEATLKMGAERPLGR